MAPPRPALRPHVPMRPSGCLLWCLTADNGDAGALTALAQELSRLRGEPVSLLLSGPQTGEDMPDPVAIRVPAPSDASAAVNAFLAKWTPDIVLVLGVPERPALIGALAALETPLLLAASHRGAFAAKRKISGRVARLIAQFDACLAPSAADAQVLRDAVSAPEKLIITGPLSDTALALTCDHRDLDRQSAALAGRPVWLAARVSRAEVAAMEAAQRRTIRAAHRLLLILVPHDLDDGADIAATFADKGWRVGLQSRDHEPNDGVQVFVADDGDALGLWYRLAPITVLGGSFDPDVDTSDPYDVAALGSAIVHGPHAGTSARLDRLRAAGATEAVDDAANLGECLFKLLSPEKTAKLAHAGWSVTSESAHVVEKLAEMMDEALDLKEAS